MGYDIGFMLAGKDDRFVSRGKQLFEQNRLPMNVLDWLKENRLAWQNKPAKIRNKVIDLA
jgi:hypothetical protein